MVAVPCLPALARAADVESSDPHEVLAALLAKVLATNFIVSFDSYNRLKKRSFPDRCVRKSCLRIIRYCAKQRLWCVTKREIQRELDFVNAKLEAEFHQRRLVMIKRAHKTASAMLHSSKRVREEVLCSHSFRCISGFSLS